MTMVETQSDTVALVGYDAENRTMHVQFKNGSIYEYSAVAVRLFEEMLRPHPWRRVGPQVKAHPLPSHLVMSDR